MVKICTFYVSRFILKREVELVNNKLSSSSFLQQTTNLNSPWICRHNVCVALIGSFTFCIWYNVQQNEWSSVEFPFCLVDYHFLSLSLHHLLVMSIQKYVHTNAKRCCCTAGVFGNWPSYFARFQYHLFVVPLWTLICSVFM